VVKYLLQTVADNKVKVTRINQVRVITNNQVKVIVNKVKVERINVVRATVKTKVSYELPNQVKTMVYSKVKVMPMN
jgi:hypothetical protein